MSTRFEPPNPGPFFSGPDSPQEADMYRCVHCGLCLSSCPTYMETGLETRSPRGRIALMKAVNEGRLGITSRMVNHWESCLQCRACEAMCPSGVPFGKLMESTRSQVAKHGKQSLRLKLAKALFLRGALPHPLRLRTGASLLRAYQRFGLQALVRVSRLLRLLPGGLAGLEAQLPALSHRFFGPSSRTYTARGEVRMVVGLLSGCVMPLMQGDTMEAAVRVLNHNGCDVVVPQGQGCCGALNVHSGDLEMGRKMARRNIGVFLEAGVDRIVVASAGCGSTMKEYAGLLEDDPDYHEKAVRFAAITQDISQLLVDLPFIPPQGHVEGRVTYQDPCHLAHAQRITAAPRAVLAAIPGLEFVEMEEPTRCCGAAGLYSATQHALSQQLLDTKMEAVAATGADRIATANPGCMVQLEAGLRRTGIAGRVTHIVDLLDEAYRAET